MHLSNYLFGKIYFIFSIITENLLRIKRYFNYVKHSKKQSSKCHYYGRQTRRHVTYRCLNTCGIANGPLKQVTESVFSNRYWYPIILASSIRLDLTLMHDRYVARAQVKITAGRHQLPMQWCLCHTWNVNSNFRHHVLGLSIWKHV